MGLLLSTVSVDVTINDLNGYTFIHPIVGFDVYTIFTIEDVQESIDFATGLLNGDFILTDDFGNQILDISNNSIMQTFVYDIDNNGSIDSINVNDVSSYRSEFLNNFVFSGFLLNGTPIIIKENLTEKLSATGLTDLETDWLNKENLTYV